MQSMGEKPKLDPVHEWRRLHLLQLKKKYKKFSAIADAAGVDPSYLSQINNRTRRMGGDFARALEEGLGLARGAMDTPIASGDDVAEERAEYQPAISDKKLERIIEAWPSLTPDQKDQAVRDITGTERSNKEILKLLRAGQTKTG